METPLMDAREKCRFGIKLRCQTDIHGVFAAVSRNFQTDLVSLGLCYRANVMRKDVWILVYVSM